MDLLTEGQIEAMFPLSAVFFTMPGKPHKICSQER
jgi:hypothetical protein